MAQPIVTVKQGQLLGKVTTDYYGAEYFSFQGIPYAKPPVGELRFKAPQPPEPWLGIKDATSEGNQCYHRHMFMGLIGSEDCLFLNVYTPQLPKKNSSLKPVMMWIHGGVYLSGSGNSDVYGPEFLITEDVVIVTINYRLGLLGFLSLQDHALGVPGNAAFKDTVLALKWIQDNIQQFSGDPSNVTIFGQSSGGASVHYLMISPMAKGLFHKAIIQSGSAFDSWSRGQPQATLIAKALKLEIADEKVVLRLLQQMSVKEILEIQEKIPDEWIQFNIRSFGAVVETQSNEPKFLPEDPRDLLISGRYNKVPLIIGYVSREGIFAALITKSKFGKVQLVHDFERVIPFAFDIAYRSDVSKTIAQKVKHFYYGDEEPSMENIDKYYLIETDTFFLIMIHNTIKHQIRTSSTPIYFYRVSIDSKLNTYKKIGRIRTPGICHCDELGYLFKSVLTPKIRPQSIEDDCIRRFVKLWTTFARTGDPNPVETNPLINVVWKPVESTLHHYLDISENLTVGINPEENRMQFWDDICSLKANVSKL